MLLTRFVIYSLRQRTDYFPFSGISKLRRSSADATLLSSSYFSHRVVVVYNPGSMRRRARINQVVSDFARKPLSQSRILDLACLEGDFAAEFAVRDAEVLGIEGRRTNLDRASARFPIPNLRFVQDDVRQLTREKYGIFDVVLCLGILYHLDAPDCFRLLESVAEVCTSFAVIDTHISLERDEVARYKGNEYWGRYCTEYDSQPSPEQVEGSTWSSIGNLRSFWLTKPSLVNAIIDAGFNSVYECQYPAWDHESDRLTLIALKGERERILAVPFDEEILGERMSEIPKVAYQLSHRMKPEPEA